MASSRDRSSLYLEIVSVNFAGPRVIKDCSAWLVGMNHSDRHSPLLQESLAIDCVLSDRASLPRPVRTRRVDLVQALSTVGIPSSNQKRDSIRSNTTVEGVS